VRAVRNTQDGVQVVEVDAPSADGVRVRVKSASICGSDLHMLDLGPLPFTLGHEFGGVLPDGTAVAVDPAEHCGVCDQCLAGAHNRCRNMILRGVTGDGGLCDEVVVPADCLVSLPPTFNVGDSALLEPAAVAVHGLRVGEVRADERVAVVGGGAIGLLAAAAAQALGCDVTVLARHDAQRVAVERIGASNAVNGEYQVVIEAAGSESSVADACDLAGPGARVVLLGVWFSGNVPLPGLAALAKELIVLPSVASNRHAGEFTQAVSVLGGNPDLVDALVTHRFGLDDAAEAFRVAADRKAGAIKIVIEP
jgi:2-desacetyl-2-hydroxyethyl bacteriochlorophyllide A dehydrogenase